MKSEVKLFAFLFIVLGLISVVSAYESQVYNFSASVSTSGINVNITNPIGVNVTNNTGTGGTGTSTGGTTTSGGGGGPSLTSTFFAGSGSAENISANNLNATSNPDFTLLNGGQSINNSTLGEGSSSTSRGASSLTGAVVGALTSTTGITSIVILTVLGLGTLGFFMFRRFKLGSSTKTISPD